MPYTSFIDSTYFVGEIQVPQAATDASLTQAIPQYEKEILIQLLGYKLYSLLIADCTGVGGIPVTQKYLDLVDGVEFTHSFNGSDITLKWEGLKSTLKQSLIAYYIYYRFIERDITRLTGTGISMSSKGNDWERVSPVNKLCTTWERMRELYGKISPEYKSIYTRPVLGSGIAGPFNSDPSALNFLFANKDDYPDWIFMPQWNINVFGI